MKKNLTWIRFGISAVTLFSSLSPSSAALLAMVPMQGGMVMPVVSYDAAGGRLHMTLNPVSVELIPLLVSHPGDGFDPEAPWFDALDPSRKGLAFSRRYGFVMDSLSDPLPPGTQIWLRKLSSSPGLDAYRNMPGTWEPIFGTAGTTNSIHWDTQMFHPAFTAPPGTNEYSAVFQAYLADTATGAEVSGSSSEPIEFNWTAIPDGRPVLTMLSGDTLSWPSTAANWRLEFATSPAAREWTPVTNAPAQFDGVSVITVKTNEAQRFFRMRLIANEHQ